jgi:hypothetical protein
MTIDEWVELNIKPNVVGIHKIDKLSKGGLVNQYDVSVLVKTELGTNIVVQPVNEFNGEFSFGNRIVKNYVGAETEPNKQQKIREALTQIKSLDPNATYIGMDTSSDLTVVKLNIGGEVKGFSLLDGELIDIKAV